MPTGTRRKTGGVLKKNSRRRVKGGTVDASIPVPLVAVAMVGGVEPNTPTVGLTNGHNICYMNSSIQLLYSIPFLHDFFIDITEDDINALTKNPKSPADANDLARFKATLLAVSRLFHLIDDAKNSNKVTVNYADDHKDDIYTPLLQSPGNNADLTFLKDKEGDVNEFIITIFQTLEEFIENPTIQKIYEKFVVKEQSEFKCVTGDDKKSETINTLYNVSLDIPDHTTTDIAKLDIGNTEAEYITSFKNLILNYCPLSIQTCLDTYTSYKPTGFNQDKNKTSSCATQAELDADPKATGQYTLIKNTLTVPDTTEAILIHLKRFIMKSDLTKKKRNDVVIASKEITIDTKKFYLDGVIPHLGTSLDTAHYTYIQYKNGNPDTVADDTTISTSTKDNNTQINTNGYVFLYRKGELPVVPQPPPPQPPPTEPPPQPPQPSDTLESHQKRAQEALDRLTNLLKDAEKMAGDINTLLDNPDPAKFTAMAAAMALGGSDIKKYRETVKTIIDSLTRKLDRSKTHVVEALATKDINVAKDAANKVEKNLTDGIKQNSILTDIKNKFNSSTGSPPTPPTPPTPPPTDSDVVKAIERLRNLLDNYKNLNIRIDELKTKLKTKLNDAKGQKPANLVRLSARLDNLIGRLKGRDKSTAEISTGLSMPTAKDTVAILNIELDTAIKMYEVDNKELSTIEKEYTDFTTAAAAPAAAPT